MKRLLLNIGLSANENVDNKALEYILKTMDLKWF